MKYSFVLKSQSELKQYITEGHGREKAWLINAKMDKNIENKFSSKRYQSNLI